MRRLLALLLLVVAVAAEAVPALAQTGEAPVLEVTEEFYGRYPRVRLNVRVSGVEEFEPTLFEVTENGGPVDELQVRAITARATRSAVLVVVDTGSDLAGAARADALRAFVNQRDTDDLIAIVAVGAETQVLTPFTNDPLRIAAGIDSLAPSESSNLYDGVIAAVGEFGVLGDEAARRSIVVLTDGNDTGSEASLADAAAALDGAGLDVYGVGLVGGDFNRSAFNALTRNATVLEATSAAELASSYEEIGRTLDGFLVEVRFRSTMTSGGEVEYQLAYLGSSVSTITEVPPLDDTLGAAIVTSEPTALPATEPQFQTSTMRVVAVGAAFAGLFLLLVVLGLARSDAIATLPSRLRAYGPNRQSAAQTEHKTGLARVPGFSAFARQAEQVAERRGVLQPLSNMLEQANILWRPGEVVIAAIGGATLLAAIIGVLTRSLPQALVTFFLLLAAIGFGVYFVASRERARFEDQLPETLALIASSLRSGQSFLQSMESVAAESPQPTAREFQRAVAEVRLGRPVGAAMGAIGERMDSDDFRWVTMATDIQREVGGNLAEILDIVSDTMLQRTRLRREIKALSAEGRISAVVLVTLPFFIFGILWFRNRDYLEPLFEETAGWLILGGAGALMVVAIVWLRRILDIEV